MQALHCGIISIPGSPKTWTWKLSPTLASQITESHKNVPKVDPRRLPKCTLKSIKMDIWASVFPVGAPLNPHYAHNAVAIPSRPAAPLRGVRRILRLRPCRRPPWMQEAAGWLAAKIVFFTSQTVILETFRVCFGYLGHHFRNHGVQADSQWTH